MRSAKVIGSILILAFVWVSASLGETQEFQGKQVQISGPTYMQEFQGKQVQINGHTYIQRDVAFDFYGKDGKGRTNIERMEKGLAPLGKDGEPVVLHHDQQKNEGARLEVTASEHRDQIKHPLRESEIDRKEFAKERVAYWKERAREFKINSATTPGRNEAENRPESEASRKSVGVEGVKEAARKVLSGSLGVVISVAVQYRKYFEQAAKTTQGLWAPEKKEEIKQQNTTPIPVTHSEETRKQSETSTDYSGSTPARSNFSESPGTSSPDYGDSDRESDRKAHHESPNVESHGSQGCCSRHGGIARCDESQGRYVCNDGTYSPSCNCERKEPPKPGIQKRRH